MIQEATGPTGVPGDPDPLQGVKEIPDSPARPLGGCFGIGDPASGTANCLLQTGHAILNSSVGGPAIIFPPRGLKVSTC